MDIEMVALLSKAHNYLGKLDMTSELIPDMNLFLSAYVRKEALLSSQIEGTQTTLKEDSKKSKRQDTFRRQWKICKSL